MARKLALIIANSHYEDSGLARLAAPDVEIRSAVVFVGKGGLGPWQKSELHAFLSEFHDRKCPVIPALLPDAPVAPALPVFLRGMTWVDFRTQNPLPIDQLIWGITGERRRTVI